MDKQDLIYFENLVNRALDDIGFQEATYSGVEEGIEMLIINISMPYENSSLNFNIPIKKELANNFSSIRAVLLNEFPVKRR